MSTDPRAGERQRLTNLHEKVTDAFDRAIMTLSGGALAVSIAFIHDVARNPEHTWVVGCSWLFFSLSLLLILMSFLASERAVVRMIGHLDAEMEEIRRGRLTDILNWTSALAFIAGVVLLVLFAWLNI